VKIPLFQTSVLIIILCAVLSGKSFSPSQADEPSSEGTAHIARTSLTNEPYVHPRLVEELVTSVADHDDIMIALDLDKSEDSNRFCCDKAEGTSYTRVTEEYYGTQHHSFYYNAIGRTDSGVYVIHTASHDGGSAIWHDLIFVVIEEDPGLKLDFEAGKAEMTRPRRVMRKLGQTFLGDKWKGQLKIVGNTLYIGKDHGWYSDDPDMKEVKERPDDWEHIVTIDYGMARER